MKTFCRLEKKLCVLCLLNDMALVLLVNSGWRKLIPFNHQNHSSLTLENERDPYSQVHGMTYTST